jgi:hypothetical protein
MKEIFSCVGNSVKKLTIRDKMKPFGFQKVGLNSKQPKVTRFGYFIMSSRTSDNPDMCYYIQKNRVNILLETNNKCKGDQCPTSQECRGNILNKSAQRNKKSGLTMS